MRLNDALIANERYRGEPTTDDEGRTQWPVYVLWDDEVPGLGVRIFPPVRGRPSRKDFLVTWKTGLKSRTMGIGTYGVDCTLRQARRTAREALELARRGQDPIEARQRALGIGTNEDLASRFLFEHSSAKKKAVTGELPPGGAAPGATTDPAGSDAPPSSEASAEAPGGSSAAAPESVDGSEPAPLAGELTTGSDAGLREIAAASVGTPSPESQAAPSAPEPAAVPEPSAVAEPVPVEAPAPTPTRTAAPTVLRVDDQRPASVPPPVAKRGPTKVRLLPVPEALYRTLEQGARQSGMTMAAYLNALIEVARAAVGEESVAEPAPPDFATPPVGETAPSLKEIFGRLQEAQAVSAGGGPTDDDPDQRED